MPLTNNAEDSLLESIEHNEVKADTQKNSHNWCLVSWLVGFYDISTLVGYLMPDIYV